MRLQYITVCTYASLSYISAGVMLLPKYQESEHGVENHFQINYLGHLYLTQLLLWKLQESGAENSWSRIINVSSVAHFVGRMDIASIGKRYCV